MASDASAALAVRQKVQNFLDAARTGNLDLFKKLVVQLDEGGKGLAKTVADVKDANKRTALHFAAREGRTEVCKYLLEELKLDVDMRDEDGWTEAGKPCVLQLSLATMLRHIHRPGRGPRLLISEISRR